MQKPITITPAEALAALNATPGMEGDTNRYFITEATPEEAWGAVIYHVGYHAEDPEESDLTGDPCRFYRNAQGVVECTGAYM